MCWKLTLMTLLIRVGGPTATIRAKAASLLLDVARFFFSGHHIHLLVIVDRLVVLKILCKWGKHDCHPCPREIVHFDVVCPLLTELQQWTDTIILMKVKSHTWCLLNECADELAELGRVEEEQVLSDSVLASKNMGPFG